MLTANVLYIASQEIVSTDSCGLTGVPEKGKLFCERVPFPEELLFLDPDRVAYRELALYEGIGRTFFSRATPAVWASTQCVERLTNVSSSNFDVLYSCLLQSD